MLVRNLFLALIFSLTGWSSAQACSVPPSSYPWIPGYNIYSHLDVKNPLDKFDYIGIVKPELRSISDDDFKYYSNVKKADKDDYAYVYFNVQKRLKGTKRGNFYWNKYRRQSDEKVRKQIIEAPENYSKPENVLRYRQAKSAAKHREGVETFYASLHQNLMFKDLLDISAPKIQRIHQGGMCGNEYQYTIFEGMTYLVFLSDENLIYLEPINPDEDSLVDWVNSKIKNKSSGYLNSSFIDLLKSSDRNRFGIFEITECQTQEETLKNVENKLPFLNNTRTLNAMKRTTYRYHDFERANYQRLVGNLKDLDLNYLPNYFQYALKEKLECSVGDLYFAFGRNKKWDEYFSYDAHRRQSDQYNWRFMRIEDEHINLNDLKTHLTFTDPEKLHLSEIIK